MDTQRALLTKIVDQDTLNQVRRAGIDITFLDDEECKQIFSYIERHYSDYKKVPSRAAVKKVFPNFSFVEYPEPLEFFINQIKEGYRRSVLEEALTAINRVYMDDTKLAEERIREALKKIDVTQKSFKDLNIVETAPDRWEQYQSLKENGIKGILTGWTKIDYETQGFHPEQFVVIVGKKYQCKSWLLCWMAYKAALAGERVLFATKEMAADDLAERIDSIYASVSYDSLRRAELTKEEENKYHTTLERIGDSGQGTITIARHSIQTIQDIEQKAIEVDATIVFVDSVYLFDANRAGHGNEVQRRMEISQRCKAAAQTLGIPLVVSTQAGRRASNKEPNLDNIEWSNAFSQDADVVVEIIRDDIDKELSQVWLYLLKCRKGQETNTCIKTDFNFMKFDEIANVTKDPSYEVLEETIWTQKHTENSPALP